MAIYYHLDRSGLLEEGQEISLDPQQPSRFGRNYWQIFERFGITEISDEYKDKAKLLKNYAEYREFWLELFRLNDPYLKELNVPSRLNCFFVVQNVDDAISFASRVASAKNSANYSYKIFEVITNQLNPTSLDMAWLDFEFPRDYTKFGYYYRHYWLGDKIDDDDNIVQKSKSIIEILLDQPLTIGKEVNYRSTLKVGNKLCSKVG